MITIATETLIAIIMILYIYCCLFHLPPVSKYRAPLSCTIFIICIIMYTRVFFFLYAHRSCSNIRDINNNGISRNFHILTTHFIAENYSSHTNTFLPPLSSYVYYSCTIITVHVFIPIVILDFRFKNIHQ